MFMMETSGEDLLDDILGEQFRDANTTHRTLLDGSASLATIEPANMQAILATSFKVRRLYQNKVKADCACFMGLGDGKPSNQYV